MPHNEWTHEQWRMFGQAVQTVLGEEWQMATATEERPWIILLHAEGYGVHLGESWPRGRLRISSDWPVDAQHNRYVPDSGGHRITGSKKKTPAQVAAEMIRRFLPASLTQWQEQRKRKTTAERYDALARAAGERIAARVGSEYRHDRKKVYFAGGEADIHGMQINLSFSNLPLATAFAILEAWRGAPQGQPQQHAVELEGNTERTATSPQDLPLREGRHACA